MDESKYNTLMAALKQVPDPRYRRGQRFGWEFLIVLVVAAVMSGERSVHGMAQWVENHHRSFLERLRPARGCIPSESTLRRVLREVNVERLEQELGHYVAGLLDLEGDEWSGYAIDGKDVRGSRTHGKPHLLVSLVEHRHAMVVAQTEVSEKRNELSAPPKLLEGRDLDGMVITADAQYTQRDLAQQITEQHGHYLMVVKSNQPRLHQAIALLFRDPPWLEQERSTEYQVCKTVEKAHGRLETRILESSTSLNDYLSWPGLQQVLRRRCRRIMLRTGAIEEQTTYAVTSLTPAQASVAQLAALWRGHWRIENCVHYVRDVTMGEDACQAHAGSLPRALAALRNAIMALFRHAGHVSIAEALRKCSASPAYALRLIGAIS
jgi:predicted transposase YbfD/YdcC